MNGKTSKYQSEVPDSALLPRDPHSGEALLPRQQPSYYAGFSILSQQSFWDAATRKVVTGRVDQHAPICFFSSAEASFWTAVFDHLIPQTDRTPDRRIPILPALDERLRLDRTSGYRFEDMPHDREAYCLGRNAINEETQSRHGADFISLPHLQQDLVLKAIHDGEPKAAREIWKRMSVHRFWQLMTGDAIDAYYAHPWAWDEIRFGGPAYPRAYIRLEHGEAEPWEVEAQRYEWIAPSHAASGEIEATHEFHTESVQHIDLPMHRFKELEEVDYVIVGVGSAGGVLLQRLARAGFNVLGLEAGPLWDTERDWVSDEAGSHELYWEDPRVTGGTDPLALGANNCGRGVGGGSVQLGCLHAAAAPLGLRGLHPRWCWHGLAHDLRGDSSLLRTART